MRTNALGLIEVIGYPAVIEAADAALKAANVQLGGIVKVDGGIMTAQILGDVGAVKAAVEAGGMAASKVGTVRATHVIPRVDESLFGKVIKLVEKDSKEEKEKMNIEPPSLLELTKEEVYQDTSLEEKTLEDLEQLQSLEETESVEKMEEEWIDSKKDVISPVSQEERIKTTEKEWSNMSNKELRELITSVGIQIAEKKLKSAKKEDLIGILKDFHKE